MPIKVAVVSQKGGVGKSSIARMIAREFWVYPIPRQRFPYEPRKVRPSRVFQVTLQGREVLPEPISAGVIAQRV